MLAAAGLALSSSGAALPQMPGMVAPPPPPADAIIQLDSRMAALERALAGVISDRERDHRQATAMFDQLIRLKSDLEARLDALERQPAVVPAPPQPADRPAPAPLSADDRYAQAVAFATQKDWAKAELAFDTFIASFPSDARLPAARFWLGRSYQEQGKHAQAAQIFLHLYEKYPDAPFAVENLFALARALADAGPDSAAQVCAVYAEIDATHRATLTPEQHATLLDRRLAMHCPG